MDVCFDLLIRSLKAMPELEDLCRVETWFGVTMVIDAGRFGWGSRLELRRGGLLPGRVMKSVSERLRDEPWEVFGLHGGGLSQMRTRPAGIKVVVA